MVVILQHPVQNVLMVQMGGLGKPGVMVIVFGQTMNADQKVKVRSNICDSDI